MRGDFGCHLWDPYVFVPLFGDVVLNRGSCAHTLMAWGNTVVRLLTGVALGY